MTAENLSGVTPEDVAFVVRSESDEGFELLELPDRWRVQKGEQFEIFNSGMARAIVEEEQPEHSDPNTTTLPSGTLRWLDSETEVPFEAMEIEGKRIRIVDVSETDRKLARFRRKLNGSSARVNALVRNSIREGIVNNGIVEGAQVVGSLDRSTPIFGVQSGDSNESTRVSACFTMPDARSGHAYLLTGSTYRESLKATSRLASISV